LVNPIAKHLLEKNFPPPLRSRFYPLVNRAYENADLLLGQAAFLNWKVGRDMKRHLRRVAVEFELKELIETGQYDVEFRISPNARKNCRHIELITKDCVLTISQVMFKDSLPRDAFFRQNHAVSNQLSLGLAMEESESFDQDDKYYMLLTHGYLNKIPDFVVLGVPTDDLKNWHYKINLVNEFKQVHYQERDDKTEQEEVIVRLKDYIKNKGELVNE
jgi:hypothetical protein